MKQLLRNSIKAVMDTYISFECACIRLFVSPQKEKVLILRKDVIGDFILFAGSTSGASVSFRDPRISVANIRVDDASISPNSQILSAVSRVNASKDKVEMISVIIPTYNYGRFLSECIDSVLAQTIDDWECIIVDNASSDDTEQIVLQYKQQDN